MHKLRVLSVLKPLRDGEDDVGRRVKTVDNVPHMLTIISEPQSARIRHKKDQAEGIPEEDEDNQFILQDDGEGFSLGSDSSESGQCDEEMEEQMFQAIQNAKSSTKKDAVEELLSQDKDMKDLLKMIAHFKLPTPE